MLSTQRPVASASARFFCAPKPGQSSVRTTFAPQRSAISRVPSVLPESTTIHSSANATDARHAATLCASSWVMRMTERVAGMRRAL